VKIQGDEAVQEGLEEAAGKEKQGDRQDVFGPMGEFEELSPGCFYGGTDEPPAVVSAARRVRIPWFLILPVLPLLLLVWLLLPKPGNADSLPVFAPVPVDKNIDRIPGRAEVPVSDGNFVSFEFEEEIDVNTETGECLLNFMNPGQSNHDVVVQLQMTDVQAVNVMGSTGRMAEEQQKLETNPRYDPENSRTVIAESGAVPPGYQLENLTLAIQPNGAVIPPGEHSAIVYLIFYDVGTHNRAMLESQLPVTINVHN
jgi:hypothetical protein